MLQLKKGIPAFQVVEGQFAGRRYTHVVNYERDDIPPEHKSKFIAVEKAAPDVLPTAKKSAKETDKESTKTAVQ